MELPEMANGGGTEGWF